MSAPTPKYFKAWLVFFLIATVGGFFVGAILGGLVGGILGVAQVGLGTIKVAAGILGFVIGVPISYFTFRWVVSEFIVKELTAVPPAIPLVPPAGPAP